MNARGVAAIEDVRRLPVTLNTGELCGIITQGDIADAGAGEERTTTNGRVLESVEHPDREEGGRHQRRAVPPHRRHRGDVHTGEQGRQLVMGEVTAQLGHATPVEREGLPEACRAAVLHHQRDRDLAERFWMRRDVARVGEGVGVVGFCMGGGVALMLAAQRPDAVKALLDPDADRYTLTAGLFGQELNSSTLTLMYWMALVASTTSTSTASSS